MVRNARFAHACVHDVLLVIWNAARRSAALGSLPVSVETGYAIGRDAVSNKIVVIRVSDGNSGFQVLLSLTCGLGRVARDEGSELPLERLGCAIAPTVRDRLGCRIGEDVLLAPLESIENP